MKRILFFFALILSSGLRAQYSINGNVVDEKASPLAFATVALLHPEDSTLAFFGVTDAEGHFQIKNIKAGKYLLQSAYIGYRALYLNVEFPLSEGENIGVLVMKPSAVNLDETEVSSERIPILIKKDTVEYDAAAFKTKPDAAAEDLLKKMPGVEVDRAGNIRAQGEDVKNVLVDGKEFFGSDPKVATKNLPADAIKKVQVYDKKSDESQVTGVDDGSHGKTINLVLKDDKKSAWFGDVLAGGGTDSHYQASAKAYHFKKSTQFAALGMLNNINQFGFSFKDYLDFNGGVGSLMNGDGNVRITGEDNSLPVNFGQPVTGLITSGAGGLNFTYEKKKDNRFNISYLGNGADKKLDEVTDTKNFSEGRVFTQHETLNELNKNRAHRLNFGLKCKADSTQTFILNGSAAMTSSKTNDHHFSQSFLIDTLLNDLYGDAGNRANAVSGTVHASYMKKLSSSWRLFKIGADGSGSHNLSNTQWENITHYFKENVVLNNQQFQDKKDDVLSYSVNTSVMRKLTGSFYMQAEAIAGNKSEMLKKEQGTPEPDKIVIDSLSPYFKTNYQWLRPAISFKRSNSKSQLNFTVQMEAGNLSGALQDGPKFNRQIIYFTPRLSWDYEYKTSHRLGFYYESMVNTPAAEQLIPTVNNTNPLQLYYGNMNLRPEYMHDANLSWVIFDQFSFTSLFVGINGTYTHDKINLSRTINNDLSQAVTLVNVPDDYRTRANMEFSTPVRKLGINLNLDVMEGWNRGINYVNAIENINTDLIQEYTLSIDNHKKDKWDVRAGGTVRFTDARYSVDRSLNSNYFHVNYFADIDFSPNTHWHFSASADVTEYDAKSFGEHITVPLLKAAITRYFLKANRGVVTLEAFDILNKNTGIERISELNYLQQKQSNIIGRYVMLTLKYRLNKFESKSGIDIKVNGK